MRLKNVPEPTRSHLAVTATMEDASLAPKKVLVVEDDPEIRAGTVRLLGRTGYQVFEADNGERGWEAVLAARPDLVLCDVEMPVLNGIELCRRVRAHPEVKTTLFMFVSSTRTQSNEQADGLDVGADGYIARPVSNRELLSRVSALIRIVEANARANEIEARLQARLAQARKMESVGVLAGGVAHEFNNMLAVILGYTDLALDELGPTQPIRSNLEHVRKAARRSADLTQQLLAYARQQTIAPQILDLNEPVSRALTAFKPMLSEAIQLDWRPGTGLWLVNVDPAQIEQVLSHLCINAWHAISGSGKLTVETANVAFDEGTSHAEIPSGQYVRLVVADTGHGMDQETQARIFEPFFTTKDVGKGTGLGLAMVYGSIKQHSGFIECASEVGKGTTFTIYLPRHV